MEPKRWKSQELEVFQLAVEGRGLGYNVKTSTFSNRNIEHECLNFVTSFIESGE